MRDLLAALAFRGNRAAGRITGGRYPGTLISALGNNIVEPARRTYPATWKLKTHFYALRENNAPHPRPTGLPCRTINARASIVRDAWRDLAGELHIVSFNGNRWRGGDDVPLDRAGIATRSLESKAGALT